MTAWSATNALRRRLDQQTTEFRDQDFFHAAVSEEPTAGGRGGLTGNDRADKCAWRRHLCWASHRTNTPSGIGLRSGRPNSDPFSTPGGARANLNRSACLSALGLPRDQALHGRTWARVLGSGRRGAHFLGSERVPKAGAWAAPSDYSAATHRMVPKGKRGCRGLRTSRYASAVGSPRAAVLHT